MTAGILADISSELALIIDTAEAAVLYIDKRELRCAYMGGNSNVPLGFISLTENLN